MPHSPVSVRTLLTLAWPLVVSRATQTVVGLGDAWMVADLGEAALAATTTGALNTFAALILPMGIVFMVGSFASQYFGKGDLDGARRYGFYGLGVAGIAQVIGFLSILAVPAVLSWLPYAPDVRHEMSGYLAWRLPSIGAAVLVEALASYYGGLGNTRLPMAISLGTMVLDLLGNWLLIGGHWGFPAMGVAGAALSSTLSTVVAAGVFLALFLRRPAAAPSLRVPKLYLAEFGRMLRFGLPSGLNWFFEFFAFLFFINVVVAGLGTTTLAALMTVMQLNSVAFMPAFGLASAGAILVGQAIGAGAKDSVPRIVRLTFAAAGTWQGLVGLCYLAFPSLLLAAFVQSGKDSAAFGATGVRMLMLSAAWQLFDAGAMVLAEALRAAGDTAFPMWTRVAIAWLIFAPGSYLTVQAGGGDVASVLWVVLYLALLSGVLWLRFRSGVWRRFELTEPVVV